MYKNFKITEKEKNQILEQHQNKGYKQPLKESTLENAVDQIGLTPEEIQALTSSLLDLGKSDFKEKVKHIASKESSNGESTEMSEEGEMSEKEFKLRSAIDKIINKSGILASLGIVPAAMFVSGNAALAAGITAFTALLFKDAAWWKKGHKMHKEMDIARKGQENQSVGDYLLGKKPNSINETQDMEEINYQDFQERDDLQELRDALNKNKTVSVAFVKPDNTVRHMAIRSKLSSYVYSDKPKTEKQQNVEMNNNLKRAIDINFYIKTLKNLKQDPDIDEVSAKQQAAKVSWRSINLENVLGFLVGGKFKDLRDENNILERFGQEVYDKLTKSMVRAMNAELQNQEQEIQNVDQDNPPQ